MNRITDSSGGKEIQYVRCGNVIQSTLIGGEKLKLLQWAIVIALIRA